MSGSLAEPGEVEQILARELEKRSKDEIGTQTRDEAAKRLGIGVTGVEALIWQSSWSIERALRVAEALGVVHKDAARAFATEAG